MSLSPARISELLRPYTVGAESFSFAWPRIHEQLAVYLDLLLKWNARVNLTAIRSPEEIVRRHFGESLFAGLRLNCSTWNNSGSESAITPQPWCDSLLDFGSGAGFPGLPIQLLWPGLPVTLAEARHKKASFLREVVRSLNLKTEVWADRVENMPASRQFSMVTMRAVDEMENAVSTAALRSRDRLIILGTQSANYSVLSGSFSGPERTAIPETSNGALLVYRRRRSKLG